MCPDFYNWCLTQALNLKKRPSVSCFSGLSWLCFEAECVSYFSPTFGAVQPDLSPVEISSLPNIGNLCAGSLSTLPPTSFPFSPWLQSITLQNSRTLFSLISICFRSINADILRSIYSCKGETTQIMTNDGLINYWHMLRMQWGLLPTKV